MSGTKESRWTKANLQKLLAAMKTSFPEENRMSTYPKALRSMDWKMVAFPPFSPEACQEKWREILHKMRKIRTLTELIDEAEDVISNPTQNIKIHPELPKRPSPPNAIFFEENCAKYHEKHPKLSHQKLFKRLVKKYEAFSEEEKAQYVKKYDIELEEYRKRMRVFRKEYTKTPYREPRTKRKRKRDSAETPEPTEDANGLPPKPPFNGYNLFCKEQGTSMTGFTGNTYVTVWAQRWRDLTDRQREEYSARCKELRTQYFVELNEYLKTFDKEKQQQILDENGIKRPPVRKKRASPKIPKKLPGEPRMPARSGNVIFCKVQMQVLKDKFPNSKERFVNANQMWQKLSNQEKERYKGEVCENMRKYAAELRKWFQTLPPAQQKTFCTRNPNKWKYLKEQIDKNEPRPAVYRPSDSEDEDIEDSSSDEEEEEEEEVGSDCYEVEEDEEDADVLMFKVF